LSTTDLVCRGLESLLEEQPIGLRRRDVATLTRIRYRKRLR
jgi:hypothetical protein